MSEIPRHWRLRKQRLCLSGFQRKTPNGCIEVSITGNSWYNLKKQNGHHPEENPFSENNFVVYQAEETER